MITRIVIEESNAGSKAIHAEHMKEQARQRLNAELNYNSVHFNHEGKTGSNLINIDRSVFKKSKAERLLSNQLRSAYKRSVKQF